jgi:drug/metabolite transporter (DMT)-like permease
VPRLAGFWRGQRNLGLLAATAAATSWGFTGIFVGKSVTEPLLLTFYRLWLAAALMCGACLLRGRKRARRSPDALEYTSAVWLVAAVALTPVTLAFGPPLGRVAAGDWRWIVLLALVPGSGHLLMIWAHRVVDAAVSAMIGAGNVIVAAIAAMIFLHQRLTVAEIAGILLAVAAISVLAVRQARKPPATPQPLLPPEARAPGPG